MSHITISLTFGDYKLDKNELPEESGIYCVYSCIPEYGREIHPIKLIYIGKSIDVEDRLKFHNKVVEFKKCLEQGEVLCYSFAPIKGKNVERAEAALIYKYQPIVNIEYKDNPLPDSTCMILDGRIEKFESNFMVTSRLDRLSTRWSSQK
jgi:excinuclease UvrABC nuclease subunit